MEHNEMEGVHRNLDDRMDRIEQILPTLATKDDLQATIAPLATKAELRAAPSTKPLSHWPPSPSYGPRSTKPSSRWPPRTSYGKPRPSCVPPSPSPSTGCEPIST